MATRVDQESGDFRLGDFLVRPQLNRISRGSESAQVEPKVMRVLLCLAERPGQVVSRERLLTSVWGDVFVSEQVLSRSISELRKVLADDSRAQNIIETIPKTGYRLVAPISEPLPDSSSGQSPSQRNDQKDHEEASSAPEMSSESALVRSDQSNQPLPHVQPAPRRMWGLPATIGVVVLLAVALAWIWRRVELETAGPLLRLTLDLAETIPPELDVFDSMALAPDGNRLVYVGRRDGKYQLFLRALDQAEATPIPGTESGYGPFFSPDGQWIGFYANGLLRKIPSGGGTAITLNAPADDAVGASWGEDGRIVYSRRVFEGLYRISSDGGEIERLTELDSSRGERSHHWPEVLPGAEAVIFTVWDGGNINDSKIVILNLKNNERRLLIDGGVCARYVPTGHLVYARRGQLFAVPFDLSRLKVTGPAARLPDRVGLNSITGAAHYTISRSGMLVSLPPRAGREDLRLLSVDRGGEARSLLNEARGYLMPRLSPDGERLAFAQQGDGFDLWIDELSNGTLRRLTFGHSNFSPVWTSDGKRIAFGSNAHGGPLNIYWKAADGSDQPERLTEGRNPQFPGAWTPDGCCLLYSDIDPETRWDIWLLDLRTPRESRQPKPWLKTKDDEMQPAVSPDGKFIAYTSSETGKWQVFVRSFTETGGKWQISTDGGVEPRWRRDGKELVYRVANRLMSVAVDTGTGFRSEKPQTILAGNYKLETVSMLPSFDLTPDGNHFILLKSESEDQPTRLHIVLNWFSELRRRLP
jgi:Tol biopolymer transport system component/DNA-binding winged helix-turn-helix (wHTH) protein